jgi:O-antigen/teichoic acid export membrane protein
MNDLKAKTIRGGAVRVGALVLSTLLRVVSMMVLSRLLEPRDFGLIGMTAAFTGILSLFRDFGLSSAAVQRASVTEEQTSTLFWINVLLGAALTVATFLFAPLVGHFYHEPQLVWVTRVMAVSFLFNGGGVQHSAILQREMRFTTLAVIDIVSLITSTIVGVCMAFAGYSYWTLVAMAVSLPLTTTIGLWIAAAWIPGMPRRQIGIRSMMEFGSALTLNGLVLYVAFNLDRVLLGRFWGPEVTGIYGRAFQLIRIPTDTLNSTVGEVAFSALSRIQDDAARLKRYFLRGYSLVLSLTLPVTVACALFADDVVAVLLGPKWKAAAQIFRLLAPTIFVFAVCNPIGWLLNALGLVGRALKIAFVLAPLMVAGYVLGLPHGAQGVALAYSVAMCLWIAPILAWAVHGTGIAFRDIVVVVSRPLASISIAAAVTYAARPFYGPILSTRPRLMVETGILLTLYFVFLLYVAGQRYLFVELLHGYRGDSRSEEKGLASA